MRWRIFAFVTLALVAPLAAAHAQTARTLEAAIKNGKPVGERTLRVHQDDDVTLRVSSDAKVDLHLHGYDIERIATPNEPAVFRFVARVTGRFSMTTVGAMPKGGKIHRHGFVVLYLEVLPR